MNTIGTVHYVPPKRNGDILSNPNEDASKQKCSSMHILVDGPIRCLTNNHQV